MSEEVFALIMFVVIGIGGATLLLKADDHEDKCAKQGQLAGVETKYVSPVCWGKFNNNSWEIIYTRGE